MVNIEEITNGIRSIIAPFIYKGILTIIIIAIITVVIIWAREKIKSACKKMIKKITKTKM